jgi:hypothetical protein
VDGVDVGGDVVGYADGATVGLGLFVGVGLDFFGWFFG